MATMSEQQNAVVDLGALLDDGEGAVVTLVAKDTRLVAHRTVLSATSPVFQAMFSHDTLEASCGEVTIPDVEGPVLRQLVGFLYTGRAPQMSGMAPQLLAAADKYGVSTLRDSCEQQVAAQLNVDNAVATAVLAERHSRPTLRDTTVAFIREHAHQVMATQSYTEAVRNHPEDVVETCRLLAESSAQASAPAAAEIEPAAPATARTQSPPPDDAAVSHFRSLSGEERGRRLREAARQGAVEEVRALLAAGADVGPRDRWRHKALYKAAENGHVKAARLLLRGGAKVEARDSWQRTPLHWAAMRGHTAVVRLLLEWGAAPNARERDGWTPLHRAAESGQAEAAAALLEAGADRAATVSGGRTALELARDNNQQQLIELLQ